MFADLEGAMTEIRDRFDRLVMKPAVGEEVQS